MIDSATNLARMGQFLPKRGNEQWGKGQLLITTQDCSCIPPESPITSHLPISKGMNDIDAVNLLFELTGITDDDMGQKEAHALDHQPLALASAGVYVRKVRNTNPDLGWEGYLQKLEKGKRERTEAVLSWRTIEHFNSLRLQQPRENCEREVVGWAWVRKLQHLSWRVPNRFFGIRVFPYLKIGIQDFKTQSDKIRD